MSALKKYFLLRGKYIISHKQNTLSDKRLASKIYKELLKLNNKEMNNLIKKIGKRS